MRKVGRTVFATILPILSLPAWVAAQAVPVLSPGQPFEGRVAYAGDVDQVAYSLLKGTTVTVWMKGLPGLKLVAPKLSVKTPSGAPVAINSQQILEYSDANGLPVYKVIELPIAQSGDYVVTLNGKQESIGSYRVQVNEAFQDNYQISTTLSPNQQTSLTFPGRAGQVIDILAQDQAANPSNQQALAIPQLSDPSGKNITPAYSSSQSGAKLSANGTTLGQDGDYKLSIINANGAPQKVMLRVTPGPFVEQGAKVLEVVEHAAQPVQVQLLDGSWVSLPPSSAQFVMDEVLVRLPENNSQGITASSTTLAAQFSQLAMRVKAKVKSNGGEWAVLNRAGTVNLGKSNIAAQSNIANSAAKEAAATLTLLADVRSVAPAGAIVELNFIREQTALPSDPMYSEQWGLQVAGFESAWDMTGGDANRTIAVLDTGIRYDHPDLSTRLTAGYDFVSDSWNAGDGNGLDPDPTDVYPQFGTHGTHVAGIAAAAHNAIGVAGATKVGKVMPLRVLGGLGGTDFDIAQAILYAARLPNASGKLPEKAASVINMSLGGPSYSEILRETIDLAHSQGVLVVAAMGNSSSTTPMYPAALPKVLSVGATDLADKKTFYSSMGSHIDVAAPGGDPYADLDGDGKADGIISTIYSNWDGPTYAQKSGTSMATPLVAGAAFLLRSFAPALTPTQTAAVLAAGAKDLGPVGFDIKHGYGRIDIAKSLGILKGNGQPAALFAYPSAIQLSQKTKDQEIAVLNTGQGGVTILGAQASVPWLSVSFSKLPGIGKVNVTCLSSILNPGTYSTELTIETSLGTIKTPVVATISNEGGPIVVSKAYTGAYDVISGEIKWLVSHHENEPLVFDLVEGTYKFFATTDLDFDGLAGEQKDLKGLGSGLGDSKSVSLVENALNPTIVVGIKEGTTQLPGDAPYDVSEYLLD